MSNSIKSSPKYGLNPMIPRCFFCGKEKNEIALLGHCHEIKDGKIVKNSDVEAPKSCVMDYEPCDACQAIMDASITIVEVVPKSEAPVNTMQISDGLVPTGRFTCVKREAFVRRFENVMEPTLYNRILKSKRIIMPTGVYSQAFQNVEHEKGDNN